MNGIWSENRYVNALINVLLFMTGINFMHYGQLILPVICFVLFIDRKLRFRVNDPIVFIVLCLFAVSFFGFSYQLGFYCVMGFTLPMAYYIGSNTLDRDPQNIRKIVYLLAVSMMCHVCLNFNYEYHMPFWDTIKGFSRIAESSTHYDFWTKGDVSSTATAINLDLMIGSLYYLVRHEKNKIVNSVMFILFFICMAYCLMMGRRTPLLLIAVVILSSFVFESLVTGNITKETRKRFFILCLLFAIVLGVSFVLYQIDFMGMKAFLDEAYIIAKLKTGLIDNSRVQLLVAAVKLLPKYLWGGQKISSEIGLFVHEFWLDIYDYAGIVTYALIVVYSIMYLIRIIRVLSSERCDLNIKTLVFGVFICIFVQLFIEPVMTGESLFVIVAVIFGALCEKVVSE